MDQLRKKKGFIWDKKTDDKNMGFAVYYGQNKSITNVQKTTMSGYTPYSVKLNGPDYELVKRLAETVDIPVIGEGRVHSPEDAVKMLEAGAFAVVVGGAITRPMEIATRFIKAVENRE